VIAGLGGAWGAVAASDAGELEASVDEHVAAGVDQIKLYARLDKTMLAVGAGRAKEHGKFVLAHLGGQVIAGEAFGLATMADAAAAGVDEFEHLVGLDTACASTVSLLM
jgi:hypothetical protein